MGRILVFFQARVGRILICDPHQGGYQAKYDPKILKMVRIFLLPG
jgi:hypothetical protein